MASAGLNLLCAESKKLLVMCLTHNCCLQVSIPGTRHTYRQFKVHKTLRPCRLPLLLHTIHGDENSNSATLLEGHSLYMFATMAYHTNLSWLSFLTDHSSRFDLSDEEIHRLRQLQKANELYYGRGIKWGSPAQNFFCCCCSLFENEKERERGSNLQRQRLASPIAQVLVAQTTQPVQKNRLRDEL